MPGEFHKPLVQNAKAFLKAQPYICVKCKKFTDTFKNYCENCGFKNSLRKATLHDFKQYIKNKQPIIQNQIKEQGSIPKSEVKPKSHDLLYKCTSCGVKLPAGYKFCPSCGSKLDFDNCRGCGRKLPTGYKFCPSCGLKLDRKIEPLIEQEKQLVPIPEDSQLNLETLESTQIKREDKLEPIVEDAQLPSEDLQLIPTEEKKKYKLTFYDCKFCGMKLPRKAIFCVQCGTIIKGRM